MHIEFSDIRAKHTRESTDKNIGGKFVMFHINSLKKLTFRSLKS